MTTLLKQKGKYCSNKMVDGAVKYERLLGDDNKPFHKLEDADHLAEIYYPEKVIVATNDGDKLCKTGRSNAWQPDGAYSYFFYEVEKQLHPTNVLPSKTTA